MLQEAFQNSLKYKCLQHCHKLFGNIHPWLSVTVLTDESFYPQRFNLHVNKQSAVGLYQGWRLCYGGLRFGLLDHTVNYTVYQTERERNVSGLYCVLN